MSYCRWSSDDYRCDLYVYDDCFDHTSVHIAATRHMIPDEALPPLLDADDPEWAAKWVARIRAVSALLDEYPIKPIGGPYDGESLTFDNPSEAAEWIERELVPLGIYRFPDYLVEDLRADAEHGLD